MVGKYLGKYFQDEPIDSGESIREEVMAPDFEIRFIDDGKGTTVKMYYHQDGRKKPVWTQEMCIAKVTKMLLDKEDPTEFWNKLSAWVFSYSDNLDPMLRCWADDCFQALENVYTKIMESQQTPAQTSPQKSESLPPSADARSTSSAPKLFAAKPAGTGKPPSLFGSSTKTNSASVPVSQKVSLFNRKES